MSAMSWFKFFPSDYLNGIASLTPEERGIYSTIFALQYDQNVPVQYFGRERVLARLCNANQARLKAVVETLIELGKLTLENGCLSNPRAADELKKVDEKQKKNRENSAKGGEATRKKWHKKHNEISETEGRSASHPASRTAIKKRAHTRIQKPDPDLERKKEAAEPEREPPQNDAVAAVETPAQAPPFSNLDENPKAVLFGEGATWLCEVAGKDRASVKSAIGQMLKMAGHDDAGFVLAILRDAKRQNVAEPISWIMGALKARSSMKAVASASIPSNFKLSKPAVRA